MKKHVILIATFIFAVIFQSCQFGAEKEPKAELTDENSIIITDKFGEKRIPKSPERVVIFDLGTLDIFNEFGLDSHVIGIPKQIIPDYLMSFSANENIINTGGLIEPNFQKVNETRPDLIIISGRQEKDYREFSSIAPTLFIELDYDNYIQSITENVNLIGKIFNQEEKAQTINEDVLHTIETEGASDETLKGLFVMYNNGKFSAYGSSSRFGFIHDDLRVSLAASDIESSNHGLSISSEYIQEKNPDILFVLDRNAAIGEEGIHKSSIENNLIKETSAYKNNRIVYLNPQIWYLAGGGVQSIKMMAKEISDAY